MDIGDRLNLNTAMWSLEDAKLLISRAASCLKYYGWIAENDKLDRMYYSIQDLLDKIDDETSRKE